MTGSLEALISGYRITQLLHVVAKFGIADELAKRPQTAEELAATVQANANALYRVMRALASIGLFSQDAEGKFQLTDESRRLRSDVPDSLRDVAITYGEPWWWQSWGGLHKAVVTGSTAFDIVQGCELFTYLKHDRGASELFNKIMHAMTTREVAALTAHYDFSATRKLLDVGGGSGALVAAILRDNPNATAEIFERPSVVEQTEARLAVLGIDDRCKVVGGDFFVSIPGGADTVTLKDIIHDWDDDRAKRILQNIREAMDAASKLLVIERLVPGHSGPSHAAMVDITMLALTGGRERTEQEYRELLAATGFTVCRVIPIGGDTNVLEAEPS